MQQPGLPPMKTILATNLKGGAGKTTLVRNLAVAAGRKVAVVDLDPQGSLSDWLEARESDDPTLIRGVGHDRLNDDLPQIAEAGFRLCLIDTPPSTHSWVRDAMSLANLVLIPVRPTCRVPDDWASARAPQPPGRSSISQ